MHNFAHTLRVYVEDTDAGGIVYYANYLKYMERGRTEYFRYLGYSKPALFEGLQFVVRDISVRYFKPATLDDEIQVSALLTRVTRVTFEMRQDVVRDGQLLAQGTVKAACIDEFSKRPRAMPKPMLATLQQQLST